MVINWEFVNSLFLSRTEKKLNEEKLMNQLLTEGQKSEGCNSTQVREINRLFSTNPQVKYKFMNTINGILKDVYPEYWKEKGQYQSNELGGVYNFEKEGRSVLNKLNTNFTAFCLLFRDVNKVLKLVDTWDEFCTSKNTQWFRDKYPEIEKYGEQLRGRIRGTGVHAAGIVASKDQISKYAPIETRKDSVSANPLHVQKSCWFCSPGYANRPAHPRTAGRSPRESVFAKCYSPLATAWRNRLRDTASSLPRCPPWSTR